MYGLNRLSVCLGVEGVYVTVMVVSIVRYTLRTLPLNPSLGPISWGGSSHIGPWEHSRLKQQSIELHGRIQQLDYTSICGFVDCAVAVDRLSFHRVQ